MVNTNQIVSVWLQSCGFWWESWEWEWAIVILTFPNQSGKRMKTSGSASWWSRRRQNVFRESNNGTLIFVGFCSEGEGASGVCVFLALVCKISVPMLAVIYISCLWVLVCIWLQRLTFLPLSYGTLLTRLECTWPCHSACQFRHSDRFEKFKPLPLQNETHVSTWRERWKYLEIFFLFFVLSILSCSSKAHSLQKTFCREGSHLQHANWNICWCVCSSPKVHVCMCERESGAGGYTWLGMWSCDSVPSCAERTCRADLTSWWMERNVGELYRRKFLHMYLMQCKKKKKKKKVLNSSNCNIFAWS